MTLDGALFDVDSVRRLEAEGRQALGDGVLMERAGQAAWRCLLERWSGAHRLLVVCGAGGNGGDGYALARLATGSGRNVVAVSVAPPRHPEAIQMRTAFESQGGRVIDWAGELPAADVIVDALTGIGLAPPLREPLPAVIRAINNHPAPVLSLDAPSGMPGEGIVDADTTLEFLLPKAALHTGALRARAGDIRLATLDRVPVSATPTANRLRPDMLSRWLQPRPRDSHKGRNGRVLCVGGDHGAGGAVILCAEAALRTGAGLVRMHSREMHVAPMLARIPEAMASLAPVPDFSWAGVIAIGPGLGQATWARELLESALHASRPLVIDADALNLVAASGHVPGPDCVATPHPGEAARLLGCTVDAIEADRFRAANALADRLRCTVVLKGPGSIVAAPGRIPVLVDAGGPGMATGGMGDVLTGIVAALMAQGLEPFEAAGCGALLHAAAADLAAADGERGLLPSDLMAPLRRLANPA